MRTKVMLRITMIGMFFICNIASAATMSNLAEELIGLRSQIESIQLAMQQERDQYQTQSNSLNLVKSDLMASNQRLESEIAQTELRLTELTRAETDASSSQLELKEFFSGAENRLLTHIEQSLPLRKKERLAALTAIDQDLAEGKSSPHLSITKLWNLLEDELRLQSDLALFKQSLEIDGKTQLVDLATIGMITAYYRSADDTYGQLIQTDDGWQSKQLDSDSAQAAAKKLFETLQKQIRTGPITLPYVI